jgi:hypothetical protein
MVRMAKLSGARRVGRTGVVLIGSSSVGIEAAGRAAQMPEDAPRISGAVRARKVPYLFLGIVSVMDAT